MQTYRIDFAYDMPEYGIMDLDADSIEEAEERFNEEVKYLYEDAKNIKIEGIMELKDGR